MATTLAPLANATSRSQLAPIRKVFHPSDFTSASEGAFRHALKIAQVARAELTVLHVAENEQARWGEFPGVREWLERWGLIPPGSGRDAIKSLGVQVQKIIVHSNDTVRACLHYLDRHPSELIVLAARQRETRAAWPVLDGRAPRGSGAGPMTLFLPDADGGFVYPSDGAVHLRSILIPIAANPDPQLAVDAATRLALTLGIGAVECTFVHVGDEASVPALRAPTAPGWTCRSDLRAGGIAGEILAAIEEHSADLVVMATDGRHGFLDAVRGNVTEAILNRSRCPLLAVPAQPPL